MTINRASVWLKLLYWFTFAAMGAGIPFTTLYYKSVLLDTDGMPALTMIGILLFVQPLLSVFANPTAGILADKFKMKSRILFFCSICTFAGILFISLAGLPMTADWTLIHKSMTIGIGIIILGIFLSPIIPLINTETLDHLHATGTDPGNYGRFRMFGSLSWIFITCFTGLLLFLFKNLVISVLLFAAGFFILALLASRGTRSKIKAVKLPLDKMIHDRVFLKFLVFAFFQGAGLLSSYNFTSYFMDDLQLNYFAIGVAFAISAIPELPVMFRAEKIKQKLGSWKMILYGTLLLIFKTILLVIFAFFQTGWLVILPMLLHGIGYSLQLNGFVTFIDKRAHKDLRATYLNVFDVFGHNLARAFGNFTSALLIRIAGSTWMMIINAGVALTAVGYFLIFIRDEQQP